MAIAFLAEFADAEGVVAAASRLRSLGYEHLEAYTPYAVVELEGILGIGRSRVPRASLVAGLSGAAGGLGIIEWTNAFDYPLNVGGRPLHSIPASVPIMFESAVLAAAITTFLVVLFVCGMPRLHDPVFEIDGFERTTVDRFWLTIEPNPRLGPGTPVDGEALRAALVGFDALRIEVFGAEGGTP